MSTIKETFVKIKQKREKNLSLEKLLKEKYILPDKKAKVVENLAFNTNANILNSLCLLGFYDSKGIRLKSLIESYSESENDNTCDTQKCKEILLTKHPQDFKEIKIENKLLKIETPFKQHSVCRMTDFFNFDENTTNLLLSKERYGKCFWHSINLTRLLTNNPNELENIHIATSQYSYVSNVFKYYHSWVEFDYKEQTFCADATRNILTKNDSYYELLNINPEQVSRIDAKTLNSEIETVEQINNNEKLGFLIYYLCDREKAITHLQEETGIDLSANLHNEIQTAEPQVQ